VAALVEAGIDRPGQLIDVANDPPRREALLERLGGSPRELDAAVAQARLYSLKGIGADHGRLLEMAGVRDVANPRREIPRGSRRSSELWLRHVVPEPPPGDGRVWVRAARRGR